MPETLMGERALDRILPAAAEAMRREIKTAGGCEVFFAGSLNAEGRVEEVRVRARGHEGAVPAVYEGLATRDVVLHNHPGGNLEPSEADLDLAVEYSHNGHGVYIIDNEVERVYVVIEPFLDEARYRLDPRELAKTIRPDSLIARTLPNFEVRPQQTQMIDMVSNAFNAHGIAVIEAPTGVGKTLAYLLPAVTWAVHNRERVVISTKTINLQEQIVFKDIPLLQQCLEEEFKAVLVKGRSNYLCHRRLQRALSEATLFDDETEKDALKAIEEWSLKTRDGSKSDLAFVPPREVWERVCSDSDTCTAAQCNQAGNCFVTKARREIAKADIVVVNHHMLFSDLAIKKELGSFSSLAVLPAYDRLIIDEAHHIEDSATEYFGTEATRNGAFALLGRFLRKERGRDRGLVPFLKIKLIQDAVSIAQGELDAILDLIDNLLLPSLAATRELLDIAFMGIRTLTAEKCGQIGRDIKWRLTEKVLADPDLHALHANNVLPAVHAVNELAVHSTALIERMKAILPAPEQPEKPLLPEIAQLQGYRDRLLRLAATLSEGTSRTLEPNTVRWIEIDGKKTHIVRLVRCPLEVGATLSEWVYPNLKSILMTSATLTVENKFDFLFNRIGLDRLAEGRVEHAILDSPFDFQTQALLCIPEGIVPPDNSQFIDESITYIHEALSITKGHAFVLFTSFYALDIAHKRLQEDLRKKGIRLLKQGSASRTNLLDQFRNDPSSVLFATDSFWEGVDVPGDALRCVILPKLPFRVPTEPILQARAEQLEAGGGNAFMDYTVPLAVIKFRQGFGRLIRRRSDWGSVILLDSRVLTKRYGKAFLDSLPGVRRISGPRQGMFLALEKFSTEKEGT